MKSGFNEGQLLPVVHFFNLGFTLSGATAVETSLPVHYCNRVATIEILCPTGFSAMLVEPTFYIGADTSIVGAIIGLDDINKPVCVAIFGHASRGLGERNSLSCVMANDR